MGWVWETGVTGVDRGGCGKLCGYDRVGRVVGTVESGVNVVG